MTPKKKPAPPATKDVQIALRLEPALDEQIRAYAARVRAETGLDVSRAAALRRLINLGLEAAKARR